MSLYLLNQLNKMNIILFKTHLNEYYHIDRNNSVSQRVYINKFNNILIDAVNQPLGLGVYISLYHKDFFDEMLYIFCKTKKGNNRVATDASMIIEYIYVLCFYS